MSHFYFDIYEARINEAYNRLKHCIVRERLPLQAVVAVTAEPVAYEKRATLKYRKIGLGENWGKTWDCAWFHVTGTVPRAWRGEYVVLNIELGGESLLFDADGCPLVGLTNGSVFDANYSKDIFHFLPKAKGGEKIDFWIDAASNGLFGVDKVDDPAWEPDASKHHGHFQSAVNALHVCRFDYDSWQLWLDIEVLRSLARTLPEGSGRRIRIVRNLSKALDLLPEERGGAKAAREYLKSTVFDIGADPASIHVSAIGHAHIDTAWLWPLRETVRKVARTWSSQIGLIKRYPGYKFGASQAQLYAYCKEHYPKLYAKIKKAVADKTWEIQGGMWVEADCNIPSGESLIRQFVEGNKFFRREFGVEAHNLWLPDVFGYSGNLPQIMKICGIDFFLTQKLSWNRYNKFPHNSFVWQGIDGSRVVSHFPPEDTYNSSLIPEELIRHETNNREAGIVDEAISLFGIGDGGGGPKEEYVERGIKEHNLNGCPRVEFSFAQEALDRIAKLAPELDTWVGELYFEMHRGTLTSQAAQKKANRRCEEALRVAEALCAAAGPKFYPKAEFERLWRDLLLCQFHDIIPGSSIARVYAECGEIVRNAARDALALARKAGRSLLKKNADAVSFFNASSTAFDGVVALPSGWAALSAADGTPLAVQKESDGTVVARLSVPGQSFATFRRASHAVAKTKAVRAKQGGAILENDLVRYVFNASLKLVSAFDKSSGREFVVKSKPGNAITLFDDHPREYDAWDFEEYAANMPVATPVNVKLDVENGPVRSVINAVFDIGKSHFSQKISLADGSARLDFATKADWRESHRLCRVAFPLDIMAADASFEVQYGVVKRPLNDNTKWQYAQFEGVGHRYADISDADFGVALLNDCKYGYRAKDGELSISLLRSPTHPDPFADKGVHEFTYAILPHTGALEYCDDVVAAAAEMNQGLLCFEEAAVATKSRLPVHVEGDGVELAVLKLADDGNDLVIRIVERRGRHTTATVAVDRAADITPCLATETRTIGAPVAAPAVFALTPFEIKTLRIKYR